MLLEGFLSGEVKKRVMNYLDGPKVYSPVNRFINEHREPIKMATEFVTNPMVFGLLTGATANVATSVASDSAMRLAGYDPSKKRYTKSLKSYVKA